MKRNTVAFVLLIIFLMILGFLSFIFFYNLKTKTINEEDFVQSLTTTGEEIYSEYYYKYISANKTNEEISDYLKKYETIGLKFDLNEIEKYSDESKTLVERFIKGNRDCKKDETMIVIYPKSPYTKTDFTSEIKMDCGYKK